MRVLPLPHGVGELRFHDLPGEDPPATRWRSAPPSPERRAALQFGRALFRWRRYSITPGSTEMKMMAMITSEKFFLTKGRLPKK